MIKMKMGMGMIMMMVDKKLNSDGFVLPEMNCLRCNHKWIPRQMIITVCPRCKSPYWNKPKES